MPQRCLPAISSKPAGGGDASCAIHILFPFLPAFHLEPTISPVPVCVQGEWELTRAILYTCLGIFWGGHAYPHPVSSLYAVYGRRLSQGATALEMEVTLFCFTVSHGQFVGSLVVSCLMYHVPFPILPLLCLSPIPPQPSCPILPHFPSLKKMLPLPSYRWNHPPSAILPSTMWEKTGPVLVGDLMPSYSLPAWYNRGKDRRGDMEILLPTMCDEHSLPIIYGKAPLSPYSLLSILIRKF